MDTPGSAADDLYQRIENIGRMTASTGISAIRTPASAT